MQTATHIDVDHVKIFEKHAGDLTTPLLICVTKFFAKLIVIRNPMSETNNGETMNN